MTAGGLTGLLRLRVGSEEEREHLPSYVLDSGVDDANAFVRTALAADRMRPKRPPGISSP